MIQKLSFPLLLLLIATLALPLQAQKWNRVKGNGNIVEQKRDLRDFDAIRVQSGIDLYVSQGNGFGVTIITDENVQDRIISRVNNGELELKVDGSISTNKLRAVVSLPAMKRLKASGGADVYGDGMFNVEDLTLEMSGGSDLEMDVAGQNLTLRLNGGSDAELSGSFQNIDAVTSGGSDLKAKNLKAQNVTINCSGGSDAWVHATSAIIIQASGASDVHYGGNPDKVQAKATSASDITRMQ